MPQYAPNAKPRPDCWNWGKPCWPHGYGIMQLPDGRMQSAHRWIYERLVGEVPDGYELDHLCRNRNCVNPDHLEVVTHIENSIRGWDVILKKRYTRLPAREEVTA